MTLEEYERVLEEKKKALHALKAEERKVQVDKELKSMQQLSSKKNNDDIFIKLVRHFYPLVYFLNNRFNLFFHEMQIWVIYAGL